MVVMVLLKVVEASRARYRYGRGGDGDGASDSTQGSVGGDNMEVPTASSERRRAMAEQLVQEELSVLAALEHRVIGRLQQAAAGQNPQRPASEE